MKPTIDSLKTLEDVHHYVVMKLREQGHPSLNYEGTCMYRGDDGMKCAIGHLIEDRYYSEDMEGASSIEPKILDCVRWSLPPSFEFNKYAAEYLSNLQEAHDMWAIDTPFPEKRFQQVLEEMLEEN